MSNGIQHDNIKEYSNLLEDYDPPNYVLIKVPHTEEYSFLSNKILETRERIKLIFNQLREYESFIVCHKKTEYVVYRSAAIIVAGNPDNLPWNATSPRNIQIND